MLSESETETINKHIENLKAAIEAMECALGQEIFADYNRLIKKPVINRKDSAYAPRESISKALANSCIYKKTRIPSGATKEILKTSIDDHKKRIEVLKKILESKPISAQERELLRGVEALENDPSISNSVISLLK